jgi:hypothetical protein
LFQDIRTGQALTTVKNSKHWIPHHRRIVTAFLKSVFSTLKTDLQVKNRRELLSFSQKLCWFVYVISRNMKNDVSYFKISQFSSFNVEFC